MFKSTTSALPLQARDGFGMPVPAAVECRGDHTVIRVGDYELVLRHGDLVMMEHLQQDAGVPECCEFCGRHVGPAGVCSKCVPF